MKLSITYNWPLGEDCAQISLGGPNIEDSKYQFRIGLIDNERSGGWLKAGWTESNDTNKLKASVKRGWKIRIEKKDKINNEVIAHEIDLDREWPSDAQGLACVDTGYWL